MNDSANTRFRYRVSILIAAAEPTTEAEFADCFDVPVWSFEGLPEPIESTFLEVSDA